MDMDMDLPPAGTAADERLLRLRRQTRRTLQQLRDARRDSVPSISPPITSIHSLLDSATPQQPSKQSSPKHTAKQYLPSSRLSHSRTSLRSPSPIRFSSSPTTSPSRQRRTAKSPILSYSRLSSNIMNLHEGNQGYDMYRSTFTPAEIGEYKEERRKREANQILNRSEDFYSDIQQFRLLHSDLCIVDDKRSRQLPSAEITTKASKIIQDKSESIHGDPDNYFRTEFLKVDERLNLQHDKHPKLLRDENPILFAPNEPPVKVSVPLHLISKEKRVYVPHRRNSFGPEDTVNIESYLHKGYEPFLWSSRVMRKNADTKNVSLEKNCRQK